MDSDDTDASDDLTHVEANHLARPTHDEPSRRAPDIPHSARPLDDATRTCASGGPAAPSRSGSATPNIGHIVAALSLAEIRSCPPRSRTTRP